MKKINIGFIIAVSIALAWSIVDESYESRIGVTDMVALNVKRPFAYRFLLPQVSAALASIFSLDPVLVARLLAAGCYIAAYHAFDALASEIPLKVRPILWSAAVVMIVAPRHYIYDPLTLLSFTLTMRYLAERRWALYWLAFILATVSKETAFLLVILYALNQYHSPAFIPRLQLHLIATVAIRTTTIYLFRDLDGGQVENNWIAYVTMAKNAPILFGIIYGALVILGLKIVKNYPHLPPYTQQGVVSILLPITILVILWGYPYEFRALIETVPILLLSFKNWGNQKAAVYPAAFWA